MIENKTQQYFGLVIYYMMFYWTENILLYIYICKKSESR